MWSWLAILPNVPRASEMSHGHLKRFRSFSAFVREPFALSRQLLALSIGRWRWSFRFLSLAPSSWGSSLLSHGGVRGSSTWSAPLSWGSLPCRVSLMEMSFVFAHGDGQCGSSTSWSSSSWRCPLARAEVSRYCHVAVEMVHPSRCGSSTCGHRVWYIIVRFNGRSMMVNMLRGTLSGECLPPPPPQLSPVVTGVRVGFMGLSSMESSRWGIPHLRSSCGSSTSTVGSLFFTGMNLLPLRGSGPPPIVTGGSVTLL
jgi:hypothetical protein